MKDVDAEWFLANMLRIARGETTADENERLRSMQRDMREDNYARRPRPRIGAGTSGSRLRRAEARRLK